MLKFKCIFFKFTVMMSLIIEIYVKYSFVRSVCMATFCSRCCIICITDTMHFLICIRLKPYVPDIPVVTLFILLVSNALFILFCIYPHICYIWNVLESSFPEQ